MITAINLINAIYIPASRAELWVDPLNAAMHEFQINTPKREAAFLAQLTQESDRFRYTKEIWGPTLLQSKYERNFDAAWPPTPEDNRNHLAYKLGNDLPGDGMKYMGRGPIENTGKKNYIILAKALGLDLENHPELLEHLETGCRAAGYFWTVGAGLNLSNAAKQYGVQEGCNLNDLADTDDIKGITYAVNGGQLGYEQRYEFWLKFKKELGVE